MAGRVHLRPQRRDHVGLAAAVSEPAVPAVGVARSQAEHALAGAGDDEWGTAGPWPARPQLALPRLVVGPSEIDPLAAQQRTKNGERFLEAADGAVSRVAEALVLEDGVARA